MDVPPRTGRSRPAARCAPLLAVPSPGSPNMSHTAHYKPNLRDLAFNLFEYLDIGKTSLGKKPFGDFDETAARQMLETFSQVAVEQLASSFAVSEHNPP